MNYKETFEALKSTRKRTEKIAILQGIDSFTRGILLYTYHPLKHYHIKKHGANTSGGETLESTKYLLHTMLDRLESRVLSGQAAKNVVRDYAASLKPYDQEILDNIFKKDQRCGTAIGTINKALPDMIPVFGCMLARKFEQDSFNGYMSLKLDGLRGVYQDGYLYTRNGHKIKGVTHITEALRLASVDSADGELLVPGEHFQDTSGNIRSHGDSSKTIFNVFDIPVHPGKFSDRLYALKEMTHKFDGLVDSPIAFVKHVKVSSMEKINRTFEKALAAGYEGLVLKTPNHLYQTKRSADWLKIKAEESEDLTVIGFFEGEGKYTGMLGGIIVDHKGVKVRAGSGFSDAERREIWEAKDSFLGRTAEIKYHEVTPDGSLRHPIFKCFRVDK